MKVFKLVRSANCSRLISHSLFFLLVSLFMLAQPLHTRAQETQDPALLQVQPFSQNTAKRARRAESVTKVGDVARAAHFVYVRSQSALVTAEDIENKLRKHPDFRPLYDYIGGVIRGTGGICLGINGTEDHVHVLAKLSPDRAPVRRIA